MDELNDMWANMLEEAKARAVAQGNLDVMQYLALKAGNDALRHAAIKWLFDAIIEIAVVQPSIKIDHISPHSFAFAKANMAGSRLKIVKGVRCLMIDAGWTRTPADGFMRYKAMAFAQINHFGMRNENIDLILLKQDEIINWHVLTDESVAEKFTLEHISRHFYIFDQ